MVYYLRYVTGIKKVVGGVSLLQLVLTWQSWAYHNVKSQWTQVLSCSSLAHSLWLKTTVVFLILTKCTPWLLIIIDPCPCGFARAFKCLSFICFAEAWMLKLIPHWSLFLPATLTRFEWSLIDPSNLLTSYPSTPATTFRSMLISILHACYDCTGFRRRSFLIEGHSFLLAFGSNYTHPSGLTWFTVRSITRRRMAKLSE
jgi:hypothetical protein